MILGNKYKGFTLVELLIAISLIGILSGVLLAVINPRGIQEKSRDSQRLSDLAKVKVALESYFADNRKYPIYTAWAKIGNNSGEALSSELKGAYIGGLPVDPKASGADCVTAGWRNYFYKSDASGSRYVLATNLETSGATACPIADICSSPCRNGTAIYYTTAD